MEIFKRIDNFLSGYHFSTSKTPNLVKLVALL